MRLRWLRSRLRRTGRDGAIERELRFHLEQQIEDGVAAGLPREEAERHARIAIGGLQQMKEACQDVHRRAWLDDFRQAIRFAFRSLRRSPGFALVVVLTLALGIGANAAIFSVVSRELLDPLPYHDPGRLVLLYSKSARGTVPFVSPREIDQLRRSSRTLTSVAAFGWYSGYTYIGERETTWWSGASVGPNFFRTLGVRPELGRLIDARDIEAGPAHVVVLSHAVWLQAFGGDPGIVGRTIRLNDAPWIVIGVTPPDFAPPARAPQVWTPLDLRQSLATRSADSPMLQAVGRIAADTPLAAVQSEIRLVAERATAGRPSSLGLLTLVTVPIRNAMVGEVRPVLLVMMGAALLVLALVCVNVAGLFLARATARSRELAVRAALGADRWRIVRQLVTETMALGLIGGGLGMVLAYWGRTALMRIGAGALPSTGAPPSIDARVLAFTCLISLVVGGASGLLPALISARRGLTATLADGHRSASSGRAGVRTGRALVAGQMALAVLLLVSAGLLGRTLFALQKVDLGFDASPHVLSLHLVLPKSYGTPEAQSQFFSEWLSRIRRLPGVQKAALIDISPWNGWNHGTFQVEHGADGHATSMDATVGGVSDGYFATVGTAITSGRAFLTSDRAGSQPVAIVSEKFAKAAWPGRSALGEGIRISGSGNAWRTVVGVAKDVREDATSELDTSVYLPARQSPARSYETLVRVPGDASLLIPAVRDAVRMMDPTLPVLAPQTLDEIMSESLTRARLPVIFIAAFALLALVLAVLGVYGIVAYSVALRTREIGIRAALGGRRADIIALVLEDGLRTAVVGAAIGILVGVIGLRLLTKLLYGVTAHDPATYAAATAVLLAACVAAMLIPAKRATRINPVEALRSD